VQRERIAFAAHGERSNSNAPGEPKTQEEDFYHEAEQMGRKEKGEAMDEQFDIIDTALAAGNFSTLAAALGAAGLIGALRSEGPFTVFAPTDDAFAKIPPQTLTELLEPGNKDRLTAILTYHVLPGKVSVHEVANLSSATTLQGQALTISKHDGVKINEARVIAPDVEATNGVIHVIDTVLLPAAAVAV